MRQNGGGSIVNVSSIAGLRGGPGQTAYSGSKGAIVAFSRALAVELADSGIRDPGSGIRDPGPQSLPGRVDTPFNEPAIAFMGGRRACQSLRTRRGGSLSRHRRSPP
jgi:NAD(P)-dependent dehydrogenase (short-subunit alcohol dehydrogenase family)